MNDSRQANDGIRTLSIEERIGIYRAIEEHRGRPLIVYVTSTRPNVAAQMAGDAVRELIDQIDAVESTETSVDILIHSTGGDPLTAWKLMSVLRERFERVAVLVPSTAFSAATLFALGADEIVMHPHASLGPIDPQITVRKADGSATTFSYEQIGALLWRAFEAIEAYMDLRVAFDPLREFLADAAGAAAIAPIAPLNLPPNAPPQIVDQTWRAAASAALVRTSKAGVEVPFKTTHAILESTRTASAYVAEGSLSAVRALGGEIEIAAVRKDAGWRPVAVPNDVAATAQE